MDEKEQLIKILEELLRLLRQTPKPQAARPQPQQAAAPSFDLVRIQKSKKAVDLSPNTIRSFFKEGLKKYKRRGLTFFSRSELERFLKEKAE